MPSVLPLDATAPNYRVGVTLNDTPYIFDVRWNGKAGAWYLDVLDINDSPIRRGIRLVLGVFLGFRCNDPRFPRGILMMGDLSGKGVDATIDDLGTRVALYHFTVKELLAIWAKPRG